MSSSRAILGVNNSYRDFEGNGFNPFGSDSETKPVTPARPLPSPAEPLLRIFPTKPFSGVETTPAKVGSSGEPSSEKKYTFWSKFSGKEDGSLAKYSKKDSSALYRIGSGRFVAQLKEKAVSLGESAVKTTERLREVGIAQSQRFMARNVAEEQKQRDELLSDGVKGAADSPAVDSNPPFSIAGTAKNQYKEEFREEGDMGNQSVQELENYAVSKCEKTTETMKNCVKLAEEIREDASKTLINLHHQGERITKSHMVAVNIDHDLSRGEKLLGSLGGIFSKTWIPKKTQSIIGPLVMRDDSVKRSNENIEQRLQLGVAHSPQVRSATRHYASSSDNAQEKIQIEKAKQDDALSDLSNLLGELKVMAVDMGCEIERQNKSLDPFLDDVKELNYRLEGARLRGRRLLRK